MSGKESLRVLQDQFIGPIMNAILLGWQSPTSDSLTKDCHFLLTAKHAAAEFRHLGDSLFHPPI